MNIEKHILLMNKRGAAFSVFPERGETDETGEKSLEYRFQDLRPLDLS